MSNIEESLEQMVDARQGTIYIGIPFGDRSVARVRLDGNFSADELEKIAALMREPR